MKGENSFIRIYVLLISIAFLVVVIIFVLSSRKTNSNKDYKQLQDQVKLLQEQNAKLRQENQKYNDYQEQIHSLEYQNDELRKECQEQRELLFNDSYKKTKD